MAVAAKQQHESLPNSLSAIAALMRSTILRSLTSRALIDRRHVACAIASADARIIQIDNPARLAIADAVLCTVLAAFDGKLADGDIVLTNDPFSGGTHLQDVTLIAPIFLTGEIVGYGVVQVPLADIGGQALGGYYPFALEIWAEGVRVTPVKLYHAGQLQQDALTMLLLNSRLPHLIEKDLEIVVGALASCKAQIGALVCQYSATGYTREVENLLGDTEAGARKTIQTLSSSTWSGASGPIHSCLDERAFHVAVQMSIANGIVTLDFSESSPAAKGFVNTTVSTAKAAALIPFLRLWSSSSVNDGLLRVLSFVIPEGSLLNAKVPMSVGWSVYHPSLTIAHVVASCLQQAQAGTVSTQHLERTFSPPTLPFMVTGCGRSGCSFPALPRL